MKNIGTLATSHAPMEELKNDYRNCWKPIATRWKPIGGKSSRGTVGKQKEEEEETR